MCSCLQVWDFDKFQECLSEEHGLPSDWVNSTLTVRHNNYATVTILLQCLQAILLLSSINFPFFQYFTYFFSIFKKLHMYVQNLPKFCQYSCSEFSKKYWQICIINFGGHAIMAVLCVCILTEATYFHHDNLFQQCETQAEPCPWLFRPARI